jgi:dephospho-CoA kinase
MLTLGLTGGLGSGKSTACKFFAQLGAEVFDADEEAKKILFSSQKVREKLLMQFGNSIITNNEIDKTSLARIVFQDRKNQLLLNDILHPLVTEEFLKKKPKITSPLFIMDAALIFESELQYNFDKTVLIFTERELRIERALKRGNLTKEQILDRINLQMSEYRKKTLADFVITNNGTEEELKNKITDLYKKLV